MASTLFAGNAWASTAEQQEKPTKQTRKTKRSSDQPRRAFGIESQEDCKVFVLTRHATDGSAGDIIHFRDLLGQNLAKGRVMSRTQSSRPGFDRLELSLAKLADKPCPKLKETVAVLGDAEVRGGPEPVPLPSSIETNLFGGYVMENWNVSEKSSGSGIAAGLMVSYEFPRSKTLGIMVHALMSNEELALKNQSDGIVGVDESTDVSRLLAGGGLGSAVHFGRNGHSRLQFLALYDMSLSGSVNFKIAGSPAKRDYEVTSRIRPGLRYDQTLFSNLLLGVGVTYSQLNMTVQDMAQSKVKITGNAVHADVSLGVAF
jgi:hypothetical protein